MLANQLTPIFNDLGGKILWSKNFLPSNLEDQAKKKSLGSFVCPEFCHFFLKGFIYDASYIYF